MLIFIIIILKSIHFLTKKIIVFLYHNNSIKINTLKHLFPFLIIFLFNSCQYFDKPVPSEKELLQKELKSINWQEVDEYPSVAECEKINDKKLRQQCFFEVMSQLIESKLDIGTLSGLYPALDTIEVKVTIFPNAAIKFEPQFPKDSVAYDTLKTDSIFQARLVDFPKINPGIKRGIPVKIQFILPVVLLKEKEAK